MVLTMLGGSVGHDGVWLFMIWLTPPSFNAGATAVNVTELLFCLVRSLSLL